MRREPKQRYFRIMAEAKKLDSDRRVPTFPGEGEETLAAIDEGIRDAEAGRIVPMEEVQKRLAQWITGSSSRKEL